jgi:arylsulfatase A-like enzyme
VLRQPAILMDIFPTALSAAGVSVEQGVKLDGVDLLPLLRRQTDARPHDALCWRLGNQSACRRGDWKIFREEVKDRWSLFDLSRDPGEQENVARRHPEKVRELEAIYAAWEGQMIKPLWIGTGRRDE